MKQEKAHFWLSDEDFKEIIEFLLENYLDVDNDILVLNALLLIKLFSNYKQKSMFSYIEVFIQHLNMSDPNKDIRIENRIKSYLCEIIGNILENYDLKTNSMVNLEDLLLRLTLTKPNFLMFSALE